MKLNIYSFKVAIPRKVLLEMRRCSPCDQLKKDLSQYPERFCSKWDSYSIAKAFDILRRNTPKGSARNETRYDLDSCVLPSVAIPRKVLLEMRLNNHHLWRSSLLSQYPERFCSKWDASGIENQVEAFGRNTPKGSARNETSCRPYSPRRNGCRNTPKGSARNETYNGD